MDNKNKFWKGVLVGALVTAFSGLIIVGMSAGIFLIGRTVIDSRPQAQVVESDQDGAGEGLDLEAVSAKIERIQGLIDEYYLFDEDIREVEDGIYAGLMYGLGDPYSVYYSAEEYAKLLENTTGTYCGIGVMVTQDRITGLISVFKVFEGTPGFEAGLQPGDLLYKVDDVEVAGVDLDVLVANHIKGKENTPVTLTVLRPETNEYMDFTMKRRNIEVPTVESRMMEDQVGYISISTFEEVTAEQFKKALEDLEDQGMEKLVVDLRNNPGGVLDTVVDMLAYILPEGKIVYTADKDGQGIMYKTENGYLVSEPYPEGTEGETRKISRDNHQLDLPLAVLVNENSASASEVFTGAVKDYKRGIIVGTTTFGKGIVQSVIPLDNGTAVKMTTAHYFTPNGADLHEKGIEPDVEVDLKEELKSKAVVPPEEDNQLQEAVKALEKK